MKIKFNNFSLFALLLLVILAATMLWIFCSHRGNGPKSLVDVETRSVFVLPLNGGDTLYFAPNELRVDSLGLPYADSLSYSIRFDYCADSATVSHYSNGLCVSGKGEVQALSLHFGKTMKGDTLMSFLQRQLNDVEQSVGVLHKQCEELDFYARTHNAIDDGYNEVMLFGQHHRQMTQHIDSALTLLRKAVTDTGLVAICRTEAFVNGKPVRIVKGAEGLVRLLPKEHADTILCGNSLMQKYFFLPFTKPRPAKFYDKGNCFQLNDCDSLLHGLCSYADGSIYCGTFGTGFQRDGTGFSVDTKMVKYGKWKEGKYVGEQMLYTPDRIYGIDISRYQHEVTTSVKRNAAKGKRGKAKTKTVTRRYGIDWSNLRITSLGAKAQSMVLGNVDYPVSFVFIKCTQGTTIQSKYYTGDLASARRHGIPVAPYHFWSCLKSGAEQARYFIKYAHLGNITMPPMLDVEPTAAQIAKSGGPKKMLQEVLVWMKAVERTSGRRPVLYVSQTFVNKYMQDAPEELLEYDVWIARYSDYRPYVKLLLWQLSPSGRVRGIQGDVDINVFNGSQEDFRKWLEK